MSGPDTLAWGLTYLAHSTALIAIAWFCARAGIVKRLGAREWLWRAALVGGIFTASLQTLGGVEPLTGSASLPGGVEQGLEAHRIDAVPASASVARVDVVPVSGSVAPVDAVPVSGLVAPVERARSEPQVTRRSRILAALEWAQAAGPALGGMMLGLWLIGLSLRARFALGRRRIVRAGAWRDELTALARTAGVRRRIRLTRSERLAAPVALGVVRPEICVPARMFEDDCAHMARPALAHELAHLARFDPLWLGITHIVRSLFFVQPLNRLAAREVAHLAELSADDWAARRTGDGVALARCLTEVAGWLRPIEPPLGTCAMVRRRGKLAERVHRLLDASCRREATRRMPALAALVLLAAAPFALPGWAASAADPGSRESERTQRSAQLELQSVDDELVAIGARLAALPSTFAAERASLESRLRGLRAQLERIRRAVERQTALSEHVSRPGGQR